MQVIEVAFLGVPPGGGGARVCTEAWAKSWAKAIARPGSRAPLQLLAFAEFSVSDVFLPAAPPLRGGAHCRSPLGPRRKLRGFRCARSHVEAATAIKVVLNCGFLVPKMFVTLADTHLSHEIGLTNGYSESILLDEV
jgi:hypothetical protein